METKKYIIKKLDGINFLDWNNIEKARIDNAPWGNDYPTYYEAYAQVVALDDCLRIKLSCLQQNPVCEATYENCDVWKDDCMEFFFMPDSEKGVYYNFECNSKGVMLVGKGDGRKNREHPQIEGGFNTAFGITAEIKNDSWTLIYNVPYSFVGTLGKMRGNFYKCEERDESKMHFQCWNNIKTEKPDFHRPEFFGDLEIM